MFSSSSSSNVESIKNILRILGATWSESGDLEAIKCADLLKSVLDQDESTTEVAAQEQTTFCSPPRGLCLKGSSPSDMGLFQALFAYWNNLKWTTPQTFKDQIKEGEIKEAHLIGPQGPLKSDIISVKLFWVSENTLVPRHSEEALEMLQILEGDEIQIGLAVDDWLERKKYHTFPPTFPKIMKTAPNVPFVAISVHTGNIEGKIWLNDRDHEIAFKYKDITDLSHSNVEEYFDKVSGDYEKAMINWGYCLPQIVADVLVDHGKVTPGNCKVIDLGCGDGAIGRALHKKGFNSITGADISSSMLKLAAEKGCYCLLKKTDILQPLPFEDNFFDVLVTSAVTTYLEPSALEGWLKVVKPGGILCIAHKASIWPLWEEEQERLQAEGRWKQIWMDSGLPYLPSLNIKGTDRARIYIYEKL